MNIALLGYGAMGQRIKTVAEEKGHSVVAIIDPQHPEATSEQLTISSLKHADVAIDFSLPATVLENIKTVMQTETRLVVGTTGWYEHIDEVQKMVEESDNGLLWSSNFSVGVNYYYKILEAASKLINTSDEFDVWANELHHRNKADSPSGTAKSIEEILLENIDRKTCVVEETLDRTIEPHEIHFSSTRGGMVNFEHTIGFDSPEDCITIKHAARNRDGYVKGAIRAAEWIFGKRGVFTFDDVIF